MAALVAGSAVWVRDKRNPNRWLKGRLRTMSDFTNAGGTAYLYDTGEVVPVTHRDISERREDQ